MQLKLHSITIEDLVPEGHFLRKLEGLVDFSFIFDEVREQLGFDIRHAGADSAYGTSLIYQVMEEMGIRLHTPRATGGVTCKVELIRDAFRYHAEEDVYVCPTGKKLTLRSLEREQFNICRVYRADRTDCRDCPLYDRCVSASQKSRTILHNIFADAVSRQRETDSTPIHRQILKLRQIWCEGSFAAQKWMHNLRRLFRRGLEAAEDHCL